MSDNSVAVLLRGSMVVVQHASQACPLAYRARGLRRRERLDQRVPESLMVTFRVVMRHEFRDGAPKMALAEHDHAVEAFFLDRAHEPLREGVAVRRSRRRSDDANAPALQERVDGR